jgi:hypothetical protein
MSKECQNPNTGSVQLIPITAIALLAAAGSNNPAAGLVADAAGVIASVFVCRLVFG